MTQTGSALRLARCRHADPGHAFGLRRGDLLVGIGHAPAPATVEMLRTVFDGGEPVPLTFRRDTVIWTILADRPDLGGWLVETAPQPPAPPVPYGVANWEIIARPDGEHDLFCLRPSVLALVLPVLWLVQQRVWTLAASVLAALAVALPAGAWLLGLIWLGVGFHLWQAGARHVRADRRAQGWISQGVVAARGEADAIAIWMQLHPGARFRFAGTPDAAVGLAS